VTGLILDGTRQALSRPLREVEDQGSTSRNAAQRLFRFCAMQRA